MSIKEINCENIPANWQWVRIGDLVSKMVGGCSTKKSDYVDDGVLVLNKGHIKTTGVVSLGDHKRYVTSEYALDNLGKIISNNKLVVTLRDLSVKADFLGLIGTYKGVEKALITQGMCSLDLNDAVVPGYLVYFSNAQIYRDYVKENKVGSTQVHLRNGQFLDAKIPLAPLEQQKRIVAEIEKQFSRLDEAVVNLKRVKANLKRYKAAVLKAAVEGKLTEEWRKQHPDVEPASNLLERILAERRQKWEEAELAKMKAKGKTPKDDKWRKKYKEPNGPELNGLPQIPDNWGWATLPQLGELNRGKSKHRPRNDPKLYGGPYPFVQTGDVRHATGVITEYTQTYSEEGVRQSRLWPVGTLCITIAANIADTAILGFEACFPDSIVGFVSETENVDTKYVEYFIRTAKEDLDRFAPATAQKNINLAILSEVAIPIMSLKEQLILIQEIESRLSVAESIERVVEINLHRQERLKQSILGKAFSGELVNGISR